MSEEGPKIESVDYFDEEPDSWTTSDTVGLIVFVSLFLSSLVIPIFLGVFWSFWLGVVVGVLLSSAWIMVLPNSCLNGGGLIFSMMAMVQFTAVLAWIVAGAVRGVSLLL